MSWWSHHLVKKIAGLLIALGLIYLYWVGAMPNLQQVNTDPGQLDQSAYLRYARLLAESDQTYVGDRNRMPLYPFVLSFLYDDSRPRETIFTYSKYLNLTLSIIILIGLFFICRHYLSLPATILLIVITGFNTFMIMATYVQAEILFYFLNFCSFLLLNHLLIQPRPRRAMVAGVILGLAHLTKASVMVGLALYVGVAILQTGYLIYRAKDNPVNTDRLLYHLTTPLIVIFMFGLIIFPYIANSKQIYGHYFYNVNTTFYIWYDSWGEVREGTRAYGDREGWPTMPPEKIPGPAKYLREHTGQQIVERILAGMMVIIKMALFSAYGYLKYLLLYLTSCLLVMIIYWRHTGRLVREYAPLWLFNSLYFPTYFLLYAWYTPIAAGERFVLAQFLPLMFALSVILFRLYTEQLRVSYRRHQLALTSGFTILIAGILAGDIYLIQQGEMEAWVKMEMFESIYIACHRPENAGMLCRILLARYGM